VISLQCPGKFQPGEATSKAFAASHRLDTYRIILQIELDVIPGRDAKTIPHCLGDNPLPLWANPAGHNDKDDRSAPEYDVDAIQDEGQVGRP